MRTILPLAVAAMVLAAASARAEEAGKATPIGEAKVLNSMSIAAAYLPPADMDPPGMDLPASQADIHLETDIHATEANPNGFGAGEWVPYLTIAYRLLNQDTGKVSTGSLMPMLDADGPHYGANVKMPGVGNYKLSLHIDPPSKQGLGHHTDKATGVGKWPQPFDVDYDFKYLPPKK